MTILGIPIDFGFALQVATVACGLTISYLFSKKGYERYAYVLNFVTLPVWVALEWYYEEYFFLLLNPIYFYLFGRAAWIHWRQDEN